MYTETKRIPKNFLRARTELTRQQVYTAIRRMLEKNPDLDVEQLLSQEGGQNGIPMGPGEGPYPRRGF